MDRTNANTRSQGAHRARRRTTSTRARSPRPCCGAPSGTRCCPAGRVRRRAHGPRARRPSPRRRGCSPGRAVGRPGPTPVDAPGSARGRQARTAQLVVLAGGRGELRRLAPSCAATSATPAPAAAPSRSISRRTPLRAARCAASVAIPSERSIIACAPPRRARGPRPAAAAGAGSAATSSRVPSRGRRGSRGPAPASPSVPVTPTSRRAARRRARRAPRLVVGPADDGHRDRQRGRARDVAAGDRRAASAARAPPRRAPAASTRVVAEARRQHRARGRPRPASAPIAARSDSAPASARWPTSAGVPAGGRGGSARPRPSCRRDVTANGPGAHDRGVVAEPAHDASERSASSASSASISARSPHVPALAVAVDDARAVEVVRRELDSARGRRGGCGCGSGASCRRRGRGPHGRCRAHAEHRVRQGLDDLALELDLLFLRHAANRTSRSALGADQPVGAPAPPPWLGPRSAAASGVPGRAASAAGRCRRRVCGSGSGVVPVPVPSAPFRVVSSAPGRLSRRVGASCRRARRRRRRPSAYVPKNAEPWNGSFGAGKSPQ